MKLEEEKLNLEKEEKENGNNKININKITIPVLSIIAEEDNLVSPMSSLAINDNISSKRKKDFQTSRWSCFSLYKRWSP